jgi:photosystem II stability/assembly factor-like uncharacterized protein
MKAGLMLKRLVVGVAVAVAAAVALPAQAATPVWAPTLVLPDQGVNKLSAFPDGTVYLSHTESLANVSSILRSKDGGQTWLPVTSPPEFGGRITTEARFATQKLGYSVFAQDRMYRTQDGATTWKPTAKLPSPLKGPAYSLGFDVLEGTQRLTVAGTSSVPPKLGCNDAAGVLWTSADAGETWRSATIGSRVTPLYVTLFDAKRGVALANELEPGEDACSLSAKIKMGIYTTADGGITWQRSRGCLRGCAISAMPTAKRIIVGHNDGSTLVTENFGKTWTEGQRLATTELPDPAGQLFWLQGMDFATDKIGYASTKGGGTWRTTDGGRSWVMEASSDAVFQDFVKGDVAALDADRAVIGGPAVIAVRTIAPA